MKKNELIKIANDWELYCDFFRGRNLETEEEFMKGDLEERIKYLIKHFGDNEIHPTVVIRDIEYDWEACVQLMDDDIREELHNDMAGECTNQEFMDAYLVKHWMKYDEEFAV